jgi:hypothetical protein
MIHGTAPLKEFESIAEIDAVEAEFLQSAVREAVRSAKRDGQHVARFSRYRVRAWREPLGSRLITITWRLSLDGLPVAGDTEILEAPPRLAA